MIVGNAAPALAAKAATTTVPIVFVTGGDPVEDGFVASMNRPGGNVTGVSFFGSVVGAKRLELLRQLVPSATTIAVLVNPDKANTEAERKDVQAAALAIGQRLIVLDASSVRDIETGFATFVQRGAGALLAGGGAFMNSNRERIVALAARHALPTSYAQRESVVAGGLMSYGAEHYRCVSPSRRLRRTDSQGRKAGRPAGHAVQQIRVPDQPQNSKDARADGAADAASRRRRGDRMRAARVHHAARRRGGSVAARGARAAAGDAGYRIPGRLIV